MRLACLYALLDRRDCISVGNLRAALALWRYCEDSARFVFGDALGDPVAEELLLAIRASADGLTRTEIRTRFSHRLRDAHRALGALAESGLVTCRRELPNGGRPPERWVATEATKGLVVPGRRVLLSLPLQGPAETAPRGDRSP
jgi:hypothetical protein